MDPIIAFGLASAIISFVDMGTKIVARLKEMSEAGDIPEVFRDMKTRLPLVISIVDRTQKKADGLSPEAQEAFKDVVRQCYEQVNQLDEILKKIMVSKGDSSLRKTIRAGVSLIEESRVQRIATALRDNVQLLTFLSVAPAENGRPRTERHPSEQVLSFPNARGLFLVPFSRDEHFIGRENNLKLIASNFKTQHRVAISGIGGVG